MKNFLFVLAIFFFIMVRPAWAAPPLGTAGVRVGQSWIDDNHADAMDTARTTETPNLQAIENLQVKTLPIPLIEMIIGPVQGVTTNLASDQGYNAVLRERSAIAGISSAIATIYSSPPADLAYWIDDTGRTLGFLPRSTQAQGIGFQGLSGLLPIWKAFRNIAYLLLALVIVVVGFMVMLRKKIDPKTVVTVQNALPRIVVTLILITFSYAIVGIVIDLMYVAIFLAISVFKSQGMLPPLAGWVNTVGGWIGVNTPEKLYTQGGLWQNVTNFDLDSAKLLFGHATVSWDTAGKSIIAVLAAIAGFAVSGVVGLGVGSLIFTSIPLLALLIAIAQLLLIIRLFFFFLGAYVKIIISLVLGPIQILAEAIPGTEAFSSWFRNLIANAAVFPVGAFMFMLAGAILEIGKNANATLWSPPYASFIVNNTASVTSWLALGILFAIPGIGAQIQEALKAKPVIDAGPGAIAGVLSQPISLIMQMHQFLTSQQTMEYMKKQAGGGKPEEHKKTQL